MYSLARFNKLKKLVMYTLEIFIYLFLRNESTDEPKSPF